MFYWPQLLYNKKAASPSTRGQSSTSNDSTDQTMNLPHNIHRAVNSWFYSKDVCETRGWRPEAEDRLEKDIFIISML